MFWHLIGLPVTGRRPVADDVVLLAGPHGGNLTGEVLNHRRTGGGLARGTSRPVRGGCPGGGAGRGAARDRHSRPPTQSATLGRRRTIACRRSNSRLNAIAGARRYAMGAELVEPSRWSASDRVGPRARATCEWSSTARRTRMARDADGYFQVEVPARRWQPLRLPARHRRAALFPTRRRALQPDGPHGLSAVVDSSTYAVARRRLARRHAARAGDLRAARRDVHRRGDVAGGGRASAAADATSASRSCR